MLPVFDLYVLEGRFTRVKCASLCRGESLCQTYFYNSDDKQCSLYNYPLLENTPVYANPGVSVYETVGKLPKWYNLTLFSLNQKRQQRHVEVFVEIIKIPVFKLCFASMFILRVISYLSLTYFHHLR